MPGRPFCFVLTKGPLALARRNADWYTANAVRLRQVSSSWHKRLSRNSARALDCNRVNSCPNGMQLLTRRSVTAHGSQLVCMPGGDQGQHRLANPPLGANGYQLPVTLIDRMP